MHFCRFQTLSFCIDVVLIYADEFRRRLEINLLVKLGHYEKLLLDITLLNVQIVGCRHATCECLASSCFVFFF